MRKFLGWCLVTIIAAIFAIGGTTALISCKNTPRVLKPKVSAEQVATCLDSIVNPRLYTSKDVFTLQEKLLVNAYIDSVFMSMDQKTLDNVSSVVLKRHHVVTKDDIVHEFIKNRAIYENLPDAKPEPPSASTTTKEEVPITSNIQIVKEGTTTVTEAPPTRVDDQPGNYKDTIIDGKHAIIKQ